MAHKYRPKGSILFVVASYSQNAFENKSGEFCESDGQGPSKRLEPLKRYFWATLVVLDDRRHLSHLHKY